MGSLIIRGGGGSGTTSDDLTATSRYVLLNMTYIGADTDDEIGIGKMVEYGEVLDSDETILPAQDIHISPIELLTILPEGHYKNNKVVQDINLFTPDPNGYNAGNTDYTIVPANSILTEDLIIKGGGNDFTAANIKNGVTIFGVTGTYKRESSFNLSSLSITAYRDNTVTVTISSVTGSGSFLVSSNNSVVKATLSADLRTISITNSGTSGSCIISVTEQGNNDFNQLTKNISVTISGVHTANDIYYKGSFAPGWNLLASYSSDVTVFGVRIGSYVDPSKRWTSIENTSSGIHYWRSTYSADVGYAGGAVLIYTSDASKVKVGGTLNIDVSGMPNTTASYWDSPSNIRYINRATNLSLYSYSDSRGNTLVGYYSKNLTKRSNKTGYTDSLLSTWTRTGSGIVDNVGLFLISINGPYEYHSSETSYYWAMDWTITRIYIS